MYAVFTDEAAAPGAPAAPSVAAPAPLKKGLDYSIDFPPPPDFQDRPDMKKGK
jgi:hypothetical protein